MYREILKLWLIAACDYELATTTFDWEICNTIIWLNHKIQMLDWVEIAT